MKYKKLLNKLAITAGLILGSLALMGLMAQPSTSIYEKTKSSVVHVIVERRDSPYRAGGSGFVVNSTNNYVVTAFHVVADQVDFNLQLSTSARIVLELPENRGIVVARLVIINPGRDLALLQIVNYDGHLPALKISDKIEVGEDAYACGYPLNFGKMFTKGIISGLDKELTIFGFGQFKDLFMSDILVAPGNSGCAIVNSRMEVIGIVQYSGAGFSSGQTGKVIKDFVQDYVGGR